MCTDKRKKNLGKAIQMSTFTPDNAIIIYFRLWFIKVMTKDSKIKKQALTKCCNEETNSLYNESSIHTPSLRH